MKHLQILEQITVHNKYYTWYLRLCQVGKTENPQQNQGWTGKYTMKKGAPLRNAPKSNN